MYILVVNRTSFFFGVAVNGWNQCIVVLVHRVQYLVWSRLLCNAPFFDPKHKLVGIGQFANIGTRIPGTSGNTSTVGVIRDAKATWNNLNFPDALLAKKRFKHILVWTTLIRNPAYLPIQTKYCTRCTEYRIYLVPFPPNTHLVTDRVWPVHCTSGFKQLSKTFCTRILSAWTGTHRLPDCGVRHWTACVSKSQDTGPSPLSKNRCRFAHASFSIHQSTSTSATVLQSYLKIRTPSFTQHCRTQSNRTNNNLKQAWSTTGSTTVQKSCRGVRFYYR